MREKAQFSKGNSQLKDIFQKKTEIKKLLYTILLLTVTEWKLRSKVGLRYQR